MFLGAVDSVDKPLCGIQLLFYELHCFTHFGSLVGLIAGVVLKHFRIFTADLQIRNIPVVHTQDQFAVHRLDQEIRNDLGSWLLP